MPGVPACWILPGKIEYLPCIIENNLNLVQFLFETLFLIFYNKENKVRPVLSAHPVTMSHLSTLIMQK